MKTISILQPWASLIIQGHKKIETRSWDTKYRGELLIHASKKKIRLQDGMFDLIDHMQRIGFWDGYLDLPYGAIIGKVNLVDTVQFESFYQDESITKDMKLDSGYLPGGGGYVLSHQERAFGDYSPGRYGWLLSDPVMFETPVPCNGQLGIWKFDWLKVQDCVRHVFGRPELAQVYPDYGCPKCKKPAYKVYPGMASDQWPQGQETWCTCELDLKLEIGDVNEIGQAVKNG